MHSAFACYSVVFDLLGCHCACPVLSPAGNIIGRTQTLTLFVESAYKEYNSEAAFAAAVLLSVLALCTLWVKDKVEQAAAAEAAK
jgi:ABC-type sulfate transport system permease subunit